MTRTITFYTTTILLSAALFFTGCATQSPSTTDTGTASPLLSLIEDNDRDDIADWCEDHSIAEINEAVAALTPTQRRALVECVIDTVDDPVRKAKITDAAFLVVDAPLLGFYTELLATTPIKVHDAGGGGYAAGDHISISTGVVLNASTASLRNTLTHELFHIFNRKNNAATGISGLNEGTAIWIFKTAFSDLNAEENALGLAEPTFGTINYYRDIKIKGYPTCIPLGIPDVEKITDKGRYVYEEILMKRDPSHLPVFDTKTMQNIYDKYYRDINRNQDFGKWLEEFSNQHDFMVAELLDTGACELPEGHTNVINTCPTPLAN